MSRDAGWQVSGSLAAFLSHLVRRRSAAIMMDRGSDHCAGMAMGAAVRICRMCGVRVLLILTFTLGGVGLPSSARCQT